MGLMGDDSTLDFEQRDPNQLNAGLTVGFSDIFGEPDASHSHECVWRLSYKCYNCGLNLCYMILTFLCSVPLSLCWGCEFAYVAFTHVWEITPCLKLMDINCLVCNKLINTCLGCILAPICETCGLLFSKIKVQNA